MSFSLNALLAVGGCFLAFGLLLGWLAGRAAGIEDERARQIDVLTKPPPAKRPGARI